VLPVRQGAQARAGVDAPGALSTRRRREDRPTKNLRRSLRDASRSCLPPAWLRRRCALKSAWAEGGPSTVASSEWPFHLNRETGNEAGPFARLRPSSWPSPPASCSRLRSLPGEPADAIYTVAPSSPSTSSAAGGGPRIRAGASSPSVSRRGDEAEGAKTRLVDLGGRTLVPGFVDPHGHVFNTGIQAISATCCRARTAR